MALTVHIRGRRCGSPPPYEAIEAAREAIPPVDLETANLHVLADYFAEVVGVLCLNCRTFIEGIRPSWELDGRNCPSCHYPLTEQVCGELN